MGVPAAAAAGRPTGCAGCLLAGAASVGLTALSGGCEDWESAEGRGWISGP